MRNPANDARAMAQTLRELGFTVLAHENATKRVMETAILEFGRRLADGGVGFFYYAGHGLQVRGRNYLMPVDAEIDSEAATRDRRCGRGSVARADGRGEESGERRDPGRVSQQPV